MVDLGEAKNRSQFDVSNKKQNLSSVIYVKLSTQNRKNLLTNYIISKEVYPIHQV